VAAVNLILGHPIMLIKPDLKDEKIIACLRDTYGLDVEKISFLPIGTDFNTAVYRVTTSNQMYAFGELHLQSPYKLIQYISSLIITPILEICWRYRRTITGQMV
jgi:spectinomycin phosphotransferase